MTIVVCLFTSGSVVWEPSHTIDLSGSTSTASWKKLLSNKGKKICLQGYMYTKQIIRSTTIRWRFFSYFFHLCHFYHAIIYLKKNHNLLEPQPHPVLL